MRKILLATTALVGVVLTGAAHAAPASPISLNVGGYNDFVAGFFSESQSGSAVQGRQDNKSFEDEFKISFDATGKASNGVEYGANIALWNGAEVGNLWRGGGQGVTVNSAYVWMSGAFGKALFGDEHGASDLFVYAPTVGEGQIDGRYRDFVSTSALANFQASGIDNTEHSTKITYYTPKIGNDTNKIQLGVSYIPNMYNYGQGTSYLQNTSNTGGTAISPYEDVVKGAAQYTGNFNPVNVTVSGQILEGSSDNTAFNTTVLGGGTNTGSGKAQDFTAWGLGGQFGIAGWTLGGSYNDLGRYDTVHGQNKAQQNFTAGAKYEFDKVGVAANWINGQGYADYLTPGTDISHQSRNETNYVGNYNAYGAGATYTWFPGLTSAVDGVLFDQKVADQPDHNDGYVVMLSQKLTF